MELGELLLMWKAVEDQRGHRVWSSLSFRILHISFTEMKENRFLKVTGYIPYISKVVLARLRIKTSLLGVPAGAWCMSRINRKGTRRSLPVLSACTHTWLSVQNFPLKFFVGRMRCMLMLDACWHFLKDFHYKPCRRSISHLPLNREYENRQEQRKCDTKEPLKSWNECR